MTQGSLTPTCLDDMGVAGIAVDLPGCPMFYLGYATGPGLLAERPGEDGVFSLLFRLVTDRVITVTDGLGIPEAALTSLVGPDTAGIQARVLPQQASPALRIIAEELRTVGYDEAGFRLNRRDYLQDIASERFVVGGRARQSLFKQLFPAHGRLARPWGGTYETVAGLRLSDVVRCHAAARERGRVVLVGDLAEARILHHVPELLEGLCPVDHQTRVEPGPQYVPASCDSGIEVIDRPDSDMVKVCVAAVAPRAGDEDSLIAELLATVVGGSPSAPLNRILRDREGAAYSPSAAYESDASYGIFWVEALVPKEKTRVALASVLRILTELAEDEVSDIWLDAVKASFATTWQALHQTPWGVGESLLTGVLGGGSRDRLAGRLRQIADLDLDRVKRVARRLFGIDGLAVALEGDRDEIERQLAP